VYYRRFAETEACFTDHVEHSTKKPTGPGWVIEEDSKTNATITAKTKTEQEKPANRVVIDGFLAEIGASVGKNIRLNDNGISAFTYELLTIVIEVPETLTSFFIYCVLVEGSKHEGNSFQKNRMMKLAMDKNYLQQGTRGGCLGTDSNGDLVYSFSDRVHEIDATVFRNILENFIDSCLNLYKDFNGKSAEVEKAVVPKAV